jgi:hypothetical protein
MNLSPPVPILSDRVPGQLVGMRAIPHVHDSLRAGTTAPHLQSVSPSACATRCAILCARAVTGLARSRGNPGACGARHLRMKDTPAVRRSWHRIGLRINHDAATRNIIRSGLACPQPLARTRAQSRRLRISFEQISVRGRRSGVLSTQPVCPIQQSTGDQLGSSEAYSSWMTR